MLIQFPQPISVDSYYKVAGEENNFFSHKLNKIKLQLKLVSRARTYISLFSGLNKICKKQISRDHIN